MQKMGIKILGTGTYLPDRVVTNEDFTKFIDTSDEWIVTHTGISSRHMSQGEPTWYMAAEAAKKALAAAGLEASQVGLIIGASVSPDFITPSMSCVVQRELGNIGSMAVDINCACSGCVYGLDMAWRYLATEPELEYVLFVGSENLSAYTDFEDRSTCVLFGDGAAAVVVGRNEGENPLYASYLGADGSGAKHLFCRDMTPHNIFMPEDGPQGYDDGLPKDVKNGAFIMNGKAVYKFAATFALPDSVKAAVAKAGLTLDDIDWFIPHQANQRIIDTAAERLNVSLDRFCCNIQSYGNTSGASIPLVLDEYIREGRIKRGQKLCFVGFGGGLTYGALVLEY